MNGRTSGQPSQRPSFAEAKDVFLLSVSDHPAVGEAACKVAIRLALSYANREEYERTGRLIAWPSSRSLSAKTGLFRSRVERGIRSLEDCGLVTVERPEKRGATHHNRYLLHFAIGRTDAANSEGEIGRTAVANSGAGIGRTDAAIEKEGIGRTDGAAMAAPVGPNSLEKPLEGAGALAARPAPVLEDEGVIYREKAKQGAEEDADVGARDRAPVSLPASTNSVPVTMEDLDRLEAEERAGCAPEGAPAPIPPAADLPDDDDEEVEVVFQADPMPSGDVLADVMEDIHARVACDAPHEIGASEFSREWYRGFVLGFPGPARLIAADTARVIARLSELEQIDPDEFMHVEEYRTDHLAAINRLARLTTADRSSAALAVEKYERAVGRRVANLKIRDGAVHA